MRDIHSLVGDAHALHLQAHQDPVEFFLPRRNETFNNLALICFRSAIPQSLDEERLNLGYRHERRQEVERCS